MKKKLSVIFAAIAATLLIATAAFASGADVEITVPDEGPVTVGSFPHLQDVTVEFFHQDGSNKLCTTGHIWKIEITGPDSFEALYDGLFSDLDDCDGADPNQIDVTVQVSIPQPGTYNIWAFTGVPAGESDNFSHDGDDEIDVIYSTGQGGGDLEIDYPAAPAVANMLLKESEIDHRYGPKGKNGGNYVSDVAGEMGSHQDDENGSWFWGIPKSDVEDYCEAVAEFLNNQGAAVDDDHCEVDD